VLLQFVVDTTGRAAAGSTKVLRSTHDDFTKAVLLVLPSFRFNPAHVNDRPVAQLVQMPFHFNLTP
jgi:TonB family protein